MRQVAQHASTHAKEPVWPWLVPLCLLPVAVIVLIATLNFAEIVSR